MDNLYTDSYQRVWGNKPINGEVEIITGVNDKLVINSDGNSYEVTLPPNMYTTEYTTNTSELIDELKKQISDNLLPINVFLGGYHMDQKYNVVVVQMQNSKPISDMTGSFFDNFML